MKKILSLLIFTSALFADGKLLGIEKITKKPHNINIVKYYCIKNHVVANYIDKADNKTIKLPVVWSNNYMPTNQRLECKDYKEWMNSNG